MEQNHQTEQQKGIEKLRELMKDIELCMLTTLEGDGHLHSRPMALQKAEFDGDLWFFTYASSPKIHEIERDPQVNVSFSGSSTWVTCSGKASLVRDKAKMKELWSEPLKAWFPKGLDEPDIGLIKVAVDRAEYWDSPSNVAVRLYGYIKAKATGKTYDEEMTDHQKLSLKNS